MSSQKQDFKKFFDIEVRVLDKTFFLWGCIYQVVYRLVNSVFNIINIYSVLIRIML